MYGQTLGLGTDAQRTAAEAQYFNDPAMQQVLGQQSNALLRKYNADGSGTGGGRLALAGARVGLENYGNWQNRLQGLGQQGFQSTGQQAQVRQGQGDTAFGYGATMAGNNINFGNAMSASRQTGVNNLLGALGTAAKAFTAFSDRRLKRDISLRGALSSGLPFYDFRYLWSDFPQIGVMAQEAMAIFPDAVFEDASGYLVVDYSKIG